MKCTVDIRCHIDEKMERSMKVLQKSVLSLRWRADSVSEKCLKRYCAILHTMSYGYNISMSIRHENGYVLMNADENSVVVLDGDREIVRKALEDHEEEDDIVNQCPF